MSLSDARLRALHNRTYDGPAELADRDGLGVRVTPKGTITFQYRFRFDGKPARLTLGRYPDIKLKTARDLLPEIRNILAQGLDPRKAWQQETKSGFVDVDECVKVFLEKRAINLKPKSYGIYKSALNKHLKGKFSGRPVGDIPLSDWTNWLDEIAEESPKLAGSCLRNAKTVLSWCARRKMIARPELLLLKTEDVGTKPDVGTRVLTLSECAHIWRALDMSRGAIITVICIKICMLTGCRQGEIREAKREHFDLDNMIWTVPPEVSKTNTPITRPITKDVYELLRQAWEVYGEDGYVLPATHGSGKERKESIPMGATAPNKIIRRMREELSKKKLVQEAWRCHDFRRTLSTRLSEMGVMPHVTEKMLGHALGGVMAVYNKHDWIEEQRCAYEMWQTALREERRKVLKQVGELYPA
ncbi:tyrosine-type recombinase/integrase [Parendozoicomonas sp. Alg238-R29]|uniref:tyrosine-type recombinase/integrase n=1 Tax=Parendozoicomonas sp. Alg238-R29 TaxID=2993446 RepID=UPI00248EE341|nr:tyrosine-type recombinase/integrase [Parendozoicomonas sp. Alg238-R29]